MRYEIGSRRISRRIDLLVAEAARAQKRDTRERALVFCPSRLLGQHSAQPCWSQAFGRRALSGFGLFLIRLSDLRQSAAEPSALYLEREFDSARLAATLSWDIDRVDALSLDFILLDETICTPRHDNMPENNKTLWHPCQVLAYFFAVRLGCEYSRAFASHSTVVPNVRRTLEVGLSILNLLFLEQITHGSPLGQQFPNTKFPGSPTFGNQRSVHGEQQTKRKALCTKGTESSPRIKLRLKLTCQMQGSTFNSCTKVRPNSSPRPTREGQQITCHQCRVTPDQRFCKHRRIPRNKCSSGRWTMAAEAEARQSNHHRHLSQNNFWKSFAWHVHNPRISDIFRCKGAKPLRHTYLFPGPVCAVFF